MDKAYDVAVLGAGMVGVSCAAWLGRMGKSVVLVDRGEPGGGTSYGNAGVFANYAGVPLNSPSLPRPLTIDWGEVVRMTPWLLAFLANCRKDRVEHIARSLSALVNQAEAGAMPLFEASGAKKLLRSRGAIYLYDTAQELAASGEDANLRAFNTSRVEKVTPDEVGQLEPGISRNHAGGYYYVDTHHYVNPQGAVQAIARQFSADGGTVLTAEIDRIEKAADNDLRLHHAGGTVRARELVLAAGAFSRLLFGGPIERLPLETERGFHVVYKGEGECISRPVGFANGGFYMTPMEQGLRVAGTVDLGGLGSNVQQANVRHIQNYARRLLPDLPDDPDQTWVGHRPTMPDSLPVIGRSKRSPEIVFAFGHQHLGMTLGGITGKLVAELITGANPSVDLAPYAPTRF